MLDLDTPGLGSILVLVSSWSHLGLGLIFDLHTPGLGSILVLTSLDFVSSWSCQSVISRNSLRLNMPSVALTAAMQQRPVIPAEPLQRRTEWTLDPCGGRFTLPVIFVCFERCGSDGR